MTDLQPCPDPPRPGLRIRPPETWGRARDDYLAGVSGPAVCARYDLGLSAFRRRAATGGWRRSDQPSPLPAGPLEVEGDLNEASYGDLAEMAAMHLRVAIVNGRVGESAAWLRLHLRLTEAARHEFEQLDALGAFDLPDDLDELHDLDGVHGPVAAGGADDLDDLDGVDGVATAVRGPRISPGTRPLPGTPAPPPSFPDPARHCDGETGRSGR